LPLILEGMVVAQFVLRRRRRTGTQASDCKKTSDKQLQQNRSFIHGHIPASCLLLMAWAVSQNRHQETIARPSAKQSRCNGNSALCSRFRSDFPALPGAELVYEIDATWRPAGIVRPLEKGSSTKKNEDRFDSEAPTLKSLRNPYTILTYDTGALLRTQIQNLNWLDCRF